MKKIFFSAFVWGVLLWTGTAAATDLPDCERDSVYMMDEVVVVETRNKAIIKPQSLSGAELERLNTLSVADALRYFSGVQIKDYGGIGGIKTVNIRSMGTNHVGVFYNGMQLGNAQNGQVDLGRYSLDNVEAISLYNGQKSDIFQPAKDFSTSSAIYIRTKHPHFKEDERFHLSAQMRTGSFGLANPSVLWEQKLSENIWQFQKKGLPLRSQMKRSTLSSVGRATDS